MDIWLTIKTEYITTDTSYRKLAKKYGVGVQTICARSKSEGWIQAREQHRNDTVTKTIQKIEEQKSGQIAKVFILADRLLEKLEIAIDELDLKYTNHKVKTEDGNTETTLEYREAEEGGTIDRAGLRQLTSTLKELQAIKGDITDLEVREREARIAALNRSAGLGDDGDDGTGVILIAQRQQ